MIKFKLNQTVTWRSSLTYKTGLIVDIMAPKERPELKYPSLKNCGSPRDHESYIVRVSRTKTAYTLYWPRVSLLNPSNALNDDEIEWCVENPDIVRDLITKTKRGQI